ncbi:MAG: Arc family DNA-binding protein [Rhizobiales bacterium]|nr:Arc family DNA-binding protein [Hyphomicrobiales bacterium]
MTKRKAFALRVNHDILNAVQRWADDDLRSLNAQIEHILRDALVKSGRVKLVQKSITEIVEIDKSK